MTAIPDIWKNVILALNIAGYVFAFFLIPRIILERRHPSATLAWMLGIALLPLIGIPLYFLIGVRRVRRHIRAKIAAVVPVSPSLSHRLRPEELPTAIGERCGQVLLAAGTPPKAGLIYDISRDHHHWNGNITRRDRGYQHTLSRAQPARAWH